MSYVLGTHSAERERLGRQHHIWRADSQAAWQRAGFQAGDRLLDLGCGPGFASLDLAELVGANGRVLAIDQSHDYISHLQQQAEALKLQQLHSLGCSGFHCSHSPMLQLLVHCGCQGGES